MNDLREVLGQRKYCRLARQGAINENLDVWVGCKLGSARATKAIINGGNAGDPDHVDRAGLGRIRELLRSLPGKKVACGRESRTVHESRPVERPEFALKSQREAIERHNPIVCLIRFTF